MRPDTLDAIGYSPLVSGYFSRSVGRTGVRARRFAGIGRVADALSGAPAAPIGQSFPGRRAKKTPRAARGPGASIASPISRQVPAATRCRRPLSGRSRLFLAVADPAPHATLLATHLPAALSTTATGHTFSWVLAIWGTNPGDSRAALAVRENCNPTRRRPVAQEEARVRRPDSRWEGTPTDSGVRAFSGSLSPRERAGVRGDASPSASESGSFDRRQVCHVPHPRPLSRRERGGRQATVPESVGAPRWEAGRTGASTPLNDPGRRPPATRGGRTPASGPSATGPNSSASTAGTASRTPGGRRRRRR